MITIRIDQADMERVKTLLQGVKDGTPKVMVRALNKTLTGVKTDASTEIRNIITASKKAVDGTFKTKNATVTTLSASFESSGKPLPLIEYSARQTKKGVSFQVKRDRSRFFMERAFIATMKSGHKGIFERNLYGAKPGVKFVSKKTKNIEYGHLPKKYRLPIHELFSSRVCDILSNKPVMAAVLKKSGARLHTNMEHELNYELSKL
jgi:hypothetical protein